MLYFYRRKAHTSETRGRHSLKCIVKPKKNVRKIESQHLKKKLRFIALMSLIINVPRERTLWMHPRTDAWFLLADEFKHVQYCQSDTGRESTSRPDKLLQTVNMLYGPSLFVSAGGG